MILSDDWCWKNAHRLNKLSQKMRDPRAISARLNSPSLQRDWNTRSTDSKILVTRGDYFINRNHIGFQGCSHSLYFENTLRVDVQKMGFLILNRFHTWKLCGMWVTHYACSANFWLPQDKDLTLAPAFQTERLRFILFAVGNFRSECKRVPDKYSEYKLAKSVGVVYVKP